jgi:hypothetical protein
MRLSQKETDMLTNTVLLERIGLTDLGLEYPELEIPVLQGLQRQGDVLVLPVHEVPEGARFQPIGRQVEVVRSEAGGNTHCLHGDGVWAAAPGAATGLVQGWIEVPEGGEAYLIHTEEHSALGIGPGRYEVRRQREFAATVWAPVVD